jgi:competence protein ComEA
MADEPDDTGTELARPVVPPDWRSLLARVAGDRRRPAAVVAAALLVLGAGAAGYAVLRTPAAPATELGLPFAGAATGGSGPAPTAASTSSTEPVELVVHAAGAVAVPGVHRVPAGSRVADLLAVAGGPAADADLDRVNLAAALADGERVWFPRVGEAAPPTVLGGVAEGDGAGTGTGTGAPAVPLDLNRATAAELDALPGIGPTIAAAIVEHRDRHGPFASVEALLDVPGIGDAKLAQLRDLVTV